MNRISRAVPVVAGAFGFAMTAMLVNACSNTPESSKRKNTSALSSRLQPLFEKTKIICFGHFTVLVPATAIVAFGPTEVEAPIAYYSGEGGKLAQRVAEQLVEVEKDRQLFTKDDFTRRPLFVVVKQIRTLR